MRQITLDVMLSASEAAAFRHLTRSRFFAAQHAT